MADESRGSDGARRDKADPKMRNIGGTVEGGKVDRRIQGEIGKQLRAVYEDVVKEPVPDRFLELLKQLEKSTGSKN
jgi:hypothetical protein